MPLKLQGQTLKTLEVLLLRENRIDADGARALANSPNLSELRALDLRGNLTGRVGTDALLERFGDRVVVE